MSNVSKMVRAAMQDKSPALFKSLSESGKLSQAVTEISQDLTSQIVTRQREIAQAHGLTDKTPPMETARILQMAAGMAREEAFGSLEFPMDETSL